MAKKKSFLEEIIMQFSIDALKKKSNGASEIPTREARVSIINIRLNKGLANDILNELVKRKKIEKSRGNVKIF